jgi:signal transduction histidine kinase
MRRRSGWLLLAIAVTAWLAVGVFMMAVAEPDSAHAPLASWLIVFGVFSAALLGSVVVGRRSRTAQLLLIGVETLAVIAMGALPGRGDPGPLLAPIALQAALVLGARWALIWVAVQSALIWAGRGRDLTDVLSWLYWGVNVAAEVIAVGAVHMLRREAETSQALAQINAELRATQALLADSAAAAERMRISRELHDAWGHDLTALSLQLEYANHASSEEARASVVEARDLAKSLLAKVRDVVGALRRYDWHDIEPLLQALAAGAPQLEVHLDVPKTLALQPADTAQTLMRAAQEIITNTLRHARARNLWLALRADEDGVRLESRDDGQGVVRLRPGNGLNGLRERFEQLGGRIVFETAHGQGFRVAGWLPARPRLP